MQSIVRSAIFVELDSSYFTVSRRFLLIIDAIDVIRHGEDRYVIVASSLECPDSSVFLSLSPFHGGLWNLVLD
jgi:hypothetical protein